MKTTDRRSMPHLIPNDVLERYTAAPSPSTVAAVKRLHENIRSVLGGDFETFLQGSYRNDTSIPDLNDVDIVAVRRTVRSGVFQPPAEAGSIVSFESIFDEVRRRLEGSAPYQGKTTKNDKCITVVTGFNADVVPAVKVGDDELKDPVAIYSRRLGQERLNYPRVHVQNGVNKQQRTEGRFKATVRMFKVWARNWFGDVGTAPSFYLESLVYSFTDQSFLPDAADRFVNLAATMVTLQYRDARVKTVAEDKEILAETEWKHRDFSRFQEVLRQSLEQARQAIGAYRETDAIAAWRRGFRE